MTLGSSSSSTTWSQNLTALENVELAAQICTDPLPADEALRLVGL